MQVLQNHLAFSVSATARSKRSCEQDGVDYFFISTADFKHIIDTDGFIEWEMVYEGMYYGTTRAEMERIWEMKKTPLLDVDVYGAIKVKNLFGDNALSIFIAPPSIEVLKERLTTRGTDTSDTINKRLSKAAEEISQKIHFDHIVLNDDLDTATNAVLSLICAYLDLPVTTIQTSNNSPHN